jgi:hypothetical protein
MDPILEVPTSSIASIVAYSGQLFTDLQLLVWLAIGLPVGFYIINKAISVVSSRAKSK